MLFCIDCNHVGSVRISKSFHPHNAFHFKKKEKMKHDVN